MAIVGTLYQIIFVPETPQWLHSMERYEESKNVLKYMAGFNMKKDYGNFSFVNEVSDDKKQASGVSHVSSTTPLSE